MARDTFKRALTALDFIPVPGPGKNLYVRPTGNNLNDGLSWETAKQTVQSAVTAAAPGDTIVIAVGDYEEAVTITKDNLTLMGVGPKGSVAIEPTGANDVAVLIDGTSGRVEEVELRNLTLGGNGTGGGLHIKGDIRRIRVRECKIEGEANGGGFDVRLESTAQGSVGDVEIEECELAWGDTAIHFKVSGGGDPVTEVLLRRNRIHDFKTVGIHVDTVHAQNVWVEENSFGQKQDGSAPTDFLLMNVASTTGHVRENYFATPTNDALLLTIGADVMWGPNGTEVGWSTARPA